MSNQHQHAGKENREQENEADRRDQPLQALQWGKQPGQPEALQWGKQPGWPRALQWGKQPG